MSVPVPGQTSWLVQTKLHPPVLRRDTIARPRLQAALQQAVAQAPVTLVSAPAGYGKTTLLASLPQLMDDHPLAWVSLDEEDNDPTRFLATLIAALQRLHPDCGSLAATWLSGGLGAAGDQGARLRRITGALINDVLKWLPRPFVLVLDDLHVLTDASLYVALDYLIDHLPPQMRLVIGTRHDPPLPIARLAARRQLAELRRLDLSFTAAEAALLLNETLGLNLPPADLAALQERTEGWAVGLCLLASSLERMRSPEQRAAFFSGMTQSERYIFDFLADEVLRTQPPDVRTFLLQTAILADLTPSACRAVTGRADSEELLDELYRRNLFLVAAGDLSALEPTYRYHALFARFLQRQLEREMGDQLADLHRRAAEAQTAPGRAIAHYLAAGLWEPAALAMERAGLEMLDRGMFETLRSWYAALPEEVRSGHPILLQLIGASEIHRGDYRAARELAERARLLFVAQGNPFGEASSLSSLMTLASQDGDMEQVKALTERALALPMSPLGQTTLYMSLAWIDILEERWAETAGHLATGFDVALEKQHRAAALAAAVYLGPVVMASPGCLELAEAFCDRASSFAMDGSPLRLALDEIKTYALALRGRVDEALALGEATEALKEQLGGYPVLGVDLVGILALIHACRGDAEAAGKYLALLERRAPSGIVMLQPFWSHSAGRTYALLGQLDEAQLCYDRLCAPSPRRAFPLVPVLQDRLGGLIALLEHRHADAEALLTRAARREEQVPVAAAGGSARMLLARLYLEQQRPDEALATAEPVLSGWEAAATPGRAILDGPVILPVLRLAAARGHAFAARLLRLFPAGGESEAAAVPGLPEPLSPREMDVLQLLAAGDSNRAIAQRLFLSEETVKSHVARLLRKLDVASRTQAAARGRGLGLID